MYVVVSKHTYSGLHTGFGAGGQVEIPKSWGGGGGGVEAMQYGNVHITRRDRTRGVGNYISLGFLSGS